MQLIDEWIDYDEAPSIQRPSHCDFHFRCRVRLTGQLDFGYGHFQFWEIPRSGQDARTERMALLRTSFPPPPESPSLNVPPRKLQYYHPQGIGGELASLLTLFTRTHFLLSAESCSSPALFTRHSEEPAALCGNLDGKKLKLETVLPLFEALKKIRGAELAETAPAHLRSFCSRFLMSARFYSLGLPLMESDDTLAYTCLVSAVEASLGNFPGTTWSFADVFPDVAPLLDKFVSAPEGREAIERALLTPTPKIKQRFIEFVTENLADSFWQDGTRPREAYSRFENLADIERYLKAIYDARSKALHEGEPVPPQSQPNTEKPLGLGMKIPGRKEWKGKELLPSVRAFERLVHHALVEHLHRSCRSLHAGDAD